MPMRGLNFVRFLSNVATSEVDSILWQGQLIKLIWMCACHYRKFVSFLYLKYVPQIRWLKFKCGAVRDYVNFWAKAFSHLKYPMFKWHTNLFLIRDVQNKGHCQARTKWTIPYHRHRKRYSRIFNNSTGTMEKKTTKISCGTHFFGGTIANNSKVWAATMKWRAKMKSGIHLL